MITWAFYRVLNISITSHFNPFLGGKWEKVEKALEHGKVDYFMSLLHISLIIFCQCLLLSSVLACVIFCLSNFEELYYLLVILGMFLKYTIKTLNAFENVLFLAYYVLVL